MSEPPKRRTIAHMSLPEGMDISKCLGSIVDLEFLQFLRCVSNETSLFSVLPVAHFGVVSTVMKQWFKE